MVSTLPIDALKLDMQFIRNAFKGRRDTRMLEVVLEIADSLMVTSIAEGVETAEQMFALKSLGCDIVQGYYFSRPVPPEEYEAFLQARREIGEEMARRGEHRHEGGRMASGAFGYESMHDALTGLYNREAFEMLARDGEHSNIALLVADMPDVGADEDSVLRAAEVLRQSFRTVDFVFRVGQGRFAVIMTRVKNTISKQIEDKVEQINARLADQADETLRFGVAFYERLNPRGTIIEDALSALEAVEIGGDSRCCIF